MDVLQTVLIGFATGAVGAAGVTGLFTLLSKKVRSPEHRQNEVEFGVGLLKDQIAKSERDSARWMEMEQFLREELRRVDSDKDRLEDLLDTARAQIRDLQTERDDLRRRLTFLAAKIARGDQITMADITGSLGQLEDTDA